MDVGIHQSWRQKFASTVDPHRVFGCGNGLAPDLHNAAVVYQHKLILNRLRPLGRDDRDVLDQHIVRRPGDSCMAANARAEHHSEDEGRRKTPSR